MRQRNKTVKVAQSCPTLCDPMDCIDCIGLYSPWNSLGQNTGVGSLSLPPGILMNPGIELGSPALQVYSLPTELSGKRNKRLFTFMPCVEVESLGILTGWFLISTKLC